MNLKTLLLKTTKEDILNELMLLYPEVEDQIFEYERACDFIYDLPVKPFSDFEILIGLVDPSKNEDYEPEIDEDAYVVVSGFDAKEDLHFALGFAKWEEWVNATIKVEEGLDISEESIVAICLYEMTFYGFDEQAIAKELESLELGNASDLFH